MKPTRRRKLYALAALYAVATGALVTALLFAGFSFWSFVIGFAVLVALAFNTRRTEIGRTPGFLSAFSFAFALLVWPVGLVLAAGIWGHWE